MGDSILVDRTLGLSKVVLKTGAGVQCPREGGEVTVRIDAKEVQFNETRTFIIGEGDSLIDEYLDSLVLTMKLGEVCTCSFPANCFDDSIGNRKPSTSVAVTICLTAVRDTPLPTALPSPVDHLDRANVLKDRAGVLVKASQWWLAARRYSRAARHAILGLTTKDLDEAVRSDLLDVRIKCHLNLAACQLSLEDMPRVVENCNKVLERQPDNIKALYRRGRALTALNEFERAEVDLQHAIKLEPSNRQVANQYEKLKACMHKQDRYYHNALKSMFNGT